MRSCDCVYAYNPVPHRIINPVIWTNFDDCSGYQAPYPPCDGEGYRFGENVAHESVEYNS